MITEHLNKGRKAMPKSRYYDIYQDLKQKIENDEYRHLELLPSENMLTEQYDCSRNTLRRAVARLVSEGYVQTMQGKGVRNIWQPSDRTAFTIGEIESMAESARRNRQKVEKKVTLFEKIAVDEKLSAESLIPVGTEAFHIIRVNSLDGKPLIIDHNYFLSSACTGLSSEIAENSIYSYLENELGMTIVNSRRMMTVEKISDEDRLYLGDSLEDCPAMAVITSWTYNSEGVMFEYTISRHMGDHFRFQDNAVRKQNAVD